eukprot:scaffold503_cov365-Prasinococcus_capsulatus_cf.AAC.12
MPRRCQRWERALWIVSRCCGIPLHEHSKLKRPRRCPSDPTPRGARAAPSPATANAVQSEGTDHLWLTAAVVSH